MIKGEEIRKRRRSLNLSVKELASLLNVSENNLYKWEKGTRPTDPEDFIKLERWLKGEKVETVPENIASEPLPSLIGKALPDDYKDRAIFNLTESYNSLARSYENLVGMVARLIEGVDPRTQEVLTATVGAIQNLLEEQFVKRTQFSSRAEVRAALNTKRDEILKKVQQVDTLDGQGKYGKVRS